MNRFTTCLTGLILLAVLATSTMADVTIEIVPVGSLGNTADDTGYGAVDYAYNIGKYEVTAGQYTEFLNAVAGVDTYGLYNGNMWSYTQGCKIERYDGTGTTGAPYQYRVPDANRVDRPVNWVSWGDAARFSNWLHNGQGSGDTEDGSYNLAGTHPYYNPDGSINDVYGLRAALMAIIRESVATWVIPTEDEWYKAAYHKNDENTGNYFDYPTSSNSTPGRDMSETTHPGNNANYYDDGYLIGSPYYTTEAGEFENSESPYDTFDQGGNLWEWNETEVVTGSSRGVRGGCWGSYSSHLAASSCCHYDDPTYECYLIGFRVASIPEPTTITLLLCGLSMLCLRRHK